MHLQAPPFDLEEQKRCIVWFCTCFALALINAPKKSLSHGVHELLFEEGQEINHQVISQHVSPQEKSFVPVRRDECIPAL